jgi:transposase
MASIESEMTGIYCFVDDTLNAHPRWAHWRTSPNATPAFTDAEVITIALLQGVLGVATLQQTYQFVADNHRDAFPHLCSYKQWVHRLHTLTPLVGLLLRASTLEHSMPQRVYLIDSKPIPMSKPIRHGRVRLLADEGAHFGKTSIGWFYGFKLHLLTHHTGIILSAILTPGNVDDRDPAMALAWSVQGGLMLGDLGYSGQEFEAELLQESGMLLITPKHAGSKGTPKRKLISQVRERIETTFSALWSQFVDRIFSRSWNGLWNTIKLKLLSYNLRQVGLLSA